MSQNMKDEMQSVLEGHYSRQGGLVRAKPISCSHSLGRKGEHQDLSLELKDQCGLSTMNKREGRGR